MQDRRGRLEFYIAAAGAVIVDQLSKFIVKSILPKSETITIIPDVFDITSYYNKGAAFGLMEGSRELLVLISIVAIFAIVKLRYQRSKSRLLAVSLGLILGGALGNLIDRLTINAVYDFLDFHRWPVFNLADVAVTIGGALLVIYWIKTPREI
ncbi:MAG: signal peptidase II [Armatimonadota bacterium]|nr:signal peptidase II [Armatimonadota bacterium]